ncbi:hypothetical protein Bcav_1866 [Beutenbergia cavernae DSM 12333]|uniref:Rhamnogalacturonase A/B/Epimerase-like pectate lyase domain-containing protein n=1 Tax=Beutenbergia cavernae (strain ATCC BAA-8 / DSM 12333 / CCUG 43141 / JCM 11478 / NBRC 16432 / NCIMB 13614 / HKI 0122) TaxID=471853 RepID=C5C4Z4_BEUC1|nr:glycosyl hydrolase family 28-related protein [Beutenbergia cavernae]ACQ80122.1 hypothetical protein Bcav_1866 [Beutenbergia cavernae DSM 12333]
MAFPETNLDRRTVLALASAGTAGAALAASAAPAAAAAAPAGAGPTAVVTDFGADPTGVEHAGAAFQACLDSLPPSGGTVLVPPGTYLLAGQQVVELRSNLTIEGAGATIVRRERTGSYTAFTGLSHGRQGRRSGVVNVTMRGLRFRGDFTARATICVMALHHCADIRIEGCEFVECQGGAGHTFDLNGCDDITFTDCTWRGYHSVPTHAPTIETIQLDASHSSAVSYPDDPGSYDALSTHHVTIERCRFLPLDLDAEPGAVVPADHARSFPAPNPVGAHHSAYEQAYVGLVMRDVEVVDPVSDPRPAQNQDNAAVRGVIHVPQARDVLLENVTVRSTTGAVSNRVVMLSSMSYGHIASADDVPGPKGYYPEPMRCADVTIRNLVVEGFTAVEGEDPAQNPIIVVSGVDEGPAENIDIQASIHGDVTTAVLVEKARNVRLALEITGSARGVDVTDSSGLNVAGGRFDDVGTPVVLTDVERFTIAGVVGTHSGTQPVAVVMDDLTDHGVIAGTRWSGYEAVATGGGHHVIERGNRATP